MCTCRNETDWLCLIVIGLAKIPLLGSIHSVYFLYFLLHEQIQICSNIMNIYVVFCKYEQKLTKYHSAKQNRHAAGFCILQTWRSGVNSDPAWWYEG